MIYYLTTAGSDYNVPDVRTVTFGPGRTEAFYEIPIVNDDDHESSETFTVSLNTTDPNVNVIDGNVTITIIDDDGKSRMDLRIELEASYKM